MPTNASFDLRIHPPFLREEREEIAAFLRSCGLEPPEEDAELTVCLLAGGRIVATGSLDGRVIRHIAVQDALRGEGLAARIVSELESAAIRRGSPELLVFTSPSNRELFELLGYRSLAEARDAVVLLEKGGGLEAWLESLRGRLGSGFCSALVMNCNPFTLGHLHLVRAAAQASERVLLFVVREDSSAFPFSVRFRLVEEGVRELPNVRVLTGSDYLVSRATFPTYFLKDRAGEAAEIHARLDATLFASRIAPALGIVRRFVAEEPYSPVTALYNEALAEILPNHGVELVVIPRLERGGAAVSASTVRRAIREGRLQEAKALVPPSTWEYLISEEARPILARLAAASGRH